MPTVAINRRTIAAVVALSILALTIAPSGNRPPRAFSFCIACGPRDFADGILNLWLFVPLGLAVGWSYRRAGAVILFGLVLSTGIELVQMIVPGRDPSLSDILFNTLGTAVGAVIARQPRVWLRPERKAAMTLVASSLVVVATIMMATAFLLSPASPAYFVTRSGNDLVLRYSTRASGTRLDEPVYRLEGTAGRALEEVRAVSVRRDRSRWLVSVTPNDTALLGPTVGQGWALLAYPDAIARRWGTVINALWMFSLFLPIGFWARGRVLAIAAAMTVLLLVLIPAGTGVVRTSTEEWLGAAIGLLAGVVLRLLLDRVGTAATSARRGSSRGG